MTDSSLQRILDELRLIKKEFPSWELNSLTEDVKGLKDNLSDLREDLSELKEILLDPEEGLIVRINKNTEFRIKVEAEEKHYREQMMELINLQRWKDGVNKALWIAFASILGIIVTIFSKLV